MTDLNLNGPTYTVAQWHELTDAIKAVCGVDATLEGGGAACPFIEFKMADGRPVLFGDVNETWMGDIYRDSDSSARADGPTESRDTGIPTQPNADPRSIAEAIKRLFFDVCNNCSQPICPTTVFPETPWIHADGMYGCPGMQETFAEPIEGATKKSAPGIEIEPPLIDQVEHILNNDVDDVFAATYNSGGNIIVLEITFAESTGDKRMVVVDNNEAVWRVGFYRDDNAWREGAAAVKLVDTEVPYTEQNAVVIADAIIATIKANPLARNVAEYFEHRLHRSIASSAENAGLAWSDFPLDSHCGEVCVQIIDKAAELLALCDSHPTVVTNITTGVTAAVEVVCFG